MDKFTILMIGVHLNDAVRKTSMGLGKEIKLYQALAHQKLGKLPGWNHPSPNQNIKKSQVL
jgi:hypothetical protein